MHLQIYLESHKFCCWTFCTFVNIYYMIINFSFSMCEYFQGLGDLIQEILRNKRQEVHPALVKQHLCHSISSNKSTNWRHRGVLQAKVKRLLARIPALLVVAIVEVTVSSVEAVLLWASMTRPVQPERLRSLTPFGLGASQMPVKLENPVL